MKYNKPYLPIKDQISLLKGRGLLFEDEQAAAEILKYISYYRLSAYWYPFKDKSHKERFLPNTSFNTVFKYYSFDRKLRLLLFDAIERIEVALRTSLSLTLADKYDPYWYLEHDYFSNIDILDKILDTFENDFYYSKEVFAQHFKSKYISSPLPPSWIALEIFSFGQLSSLFSNLKKRDDKQLVANQFGIRHELLVSWIHSLSYIRNICAHHSRVWNRSLGIRPAIPNAKNFKWLKSKSTLKNNKIYFILCIIQFLLNSIHPDNTFGKSLKNLLDDYQELKLNPMNFQLNWNKEHFWKF